MDLSFLHKKKLDIIKICISFNPCSYGSFVLTDSDFDTMQKSTVVSILVLMDLSFLHTIMNGMQGMQGKFQSLFLWIFRSYTLLHSCIICRISKSFNPCSYGSFVLTYLNEMLYARLNNMFQSLFLWIFRSYTTQTTTIAALRDLVSILVLMDLSFLLYEKNGRWMDDIEFQSLFLWIFRSY